MYGRNLAPGVILIALGALFLFVQLTDVGGEAVVAVIGGAFLVTYAFTRHYGFLVPGGILTGLGLGIVFQSTGTPEEGGVVVLGLGAGFLSIYVIDLLVRPASALWWPIIPGGILTTIGVMLQADQSELLGELEWVWPLMLIVMGVLVLSAQIRRRTDRIHVSAPQASSGAETLERTESAEARPPAGEAASAPR
jgi:hypothetical protein